MIAMHQQPSVVDLTSPVWVRERDIPLDEAGPREGIEMRDFRIYDAGSGVTLLAATTLTTASFYSPRHHHTFDQVRYYIKGRTKYGRETYGPGHCIYLPEGAYYGPMTSHEGEECQGISVQFPGPSGIFYPNPRDKVRAVEKLTAAGGKFERGVYYPTNGKPKDAFEAILEYLTGKPVEYPTPRIQGPVTMYTPEYRWSPLEGSSGALVKQVAFFNETGPNIRLLKLRPGASMLPSVNSWQDLFFVIEGAVEYEADRFDAITCGYFPADVPRGAITGAAPDGSVLLWIQFSVPGREPPASSRV